MSTFSGTILLIFVLKFLQFSYPAMVEPSVYDLLSLRLDKMLFEMKMMKTKVESIENRVGDIENKVCVDADLSKPISATDDKGNDMDGTALALAVKTLASEKRILRQTVGIIEDQFGKFKSDIKDEIAEFKISVKEQLEKVSTATESVNNSVNKSILEISNEMLEFKQNLASLPQMYDTVSRDLQSVNVSVMKNAKGIFDVVNSARAMTQNISSLQTNYDVTLKDFRQTLRSEVEGIQNHISEETKVKPRTKSSFTARFAERLSNGVLRYAIVIHNEGSEFNQNTGTFTSRVPGLYMFVANVVDSGSANNFVFCELRKNTYSIVHISSRNGKDSTGSYTKAGFGAATGAATLHLSPGDSVDVRCSSKTSSVMWSSFTGCLIAEDP